MKKIFGLFSALLLTLSIAIPCVAYAMEPRGIYGPYENFEELYAAYMEAVENNDIALQEQLVEIGWSSLYAEIEADENNGIQTIADAEDEYWREFFTDYFSYGYFEERSTGWTLSLGNKLKNWSTEQKSIGWNATYSKFVYDSHWDNTNMMQEQFYCHARLGYALIESEWNLEPWRKSMNPITCN